MTAVAFFDNEIEAELARGALESEGIAAQVRFSAKAGYPRYAAGYGGFGVGVPLSTYEVLVAEEHANEARAMLALAEPREVHPGVWRRWIFRVVTIVVLFAFLWTALQQLSAFF